MAGEPQNERNYMKRLALTLALILVAFIGCDESKRTFNSTTNIECCDSTKIVYDSVKVVCYERWFKEHGKSLKHHHFPLPECVLPVGN